MKFIIILLMLLAPCLSNATNYYVATGGNDNGLGTIGDPWETINKINISTFLPSDNIYLNRGNTWGEKLLIPSSGNVTGNITFGAYGTGALPMIDGSLLTLPQYHGLIRGDNRSYITIENIRVQNAGVDGGLSNSGIGFLNGSNITIQDCEVSNTEEAGIKFNNTDAVYVYRNDVTLTNCNGPSEQISVLGADGFEIANNVSYTNCDQVSAQSGGAGIDAKQGAKNGRIHHNEVYDICNSSNGIYIDAFDLETFNIEVDHNYVHDTCGSGIMIGAESGGFLHDINIHHNIVKKAGRGGMAFHDQITTGAAVENIYIYNNTFNENGTNGINYYGGIRIWDSLISTSGLIFKNNIMSNAYNFQIGVDGIPASVAVVDTNVIYGVNADTGGFIAISGTNTISGNPVFTDSANGDFSLATGSSAINACDNTVWQGTADVLDYNEVAITDGAGNIIVAGGTVSCGAIEYLFSNGGSIISGGGSFISGGGTLQ